MVERIHRCAHTVYIFLFFLHMTSSSSKSSLLDLGQCYLGTFLGGTDWANLCVCVQAFVIKGDIIMFIRENYIIKLKNEINLIKRINLPSLK